MNEASMETVPNCGDQGTHCRLQGKRRIRRVAARGWEGPSVSSTGHTDHWGGKEMPSCTPRGGGGIWCLRPGPGATDRLIESPPLPRRAPRGGGGRLEDLARGIPMAQKELIESEIKKTNLSWMRRHEGGVCPLDIFSQRTRVRERGGGRGRAEKRGRESGGPRRRGRTTGVGGGGCVLLKGGRRASVGPDASGTCSPNPVVLCAKKRPVGSVPEKVDDRAATMWEGPGRSAPGMEAGWGAAGRDVLGVRKGGNGSMGGGHRSRRASPTRVEVWRWFVHGSHAVSSNKMLPWMVRCGLW